MHFIGEIHFVWLLHSARMQEFFFFFFLNMNFNLVFVYFMSYIPEFLVSIHLLLPFFSCVKHISSCYFMSCHLRENTVDEHKLIRVYAIPFCTQEEYGLEEMTYPLEKRYAQLWLLKR